MNKYDAFHGNLILDAKMSIAIHNYSNVISQTLYPHSGSLPILQLPHPRYYNPCIHLLIIMCMPLELSTPRLVSFLLSSIVLTYDTNVLSISNVPSMGKLLPMRITVLMHPPLAPGSKFSRGRNKHEKSHHNKGG